MKVYVSTGGYAHPDWEGTFYPPEMKPSHFLSHYAQHFNAAEVNASFYSPVGQKSFAGMLERSGGRLAFSIKLHQIFTHARDCDADWVRRVLDGPKPIRDAQKLHFFLAQFPHSFQRTRENRAYLLGLTRAFAGEPLALEFRHDSWNVPEVRQAVLDQGWVWVSPDLPALGGLSRGFWEPCGSALYWRLHGRNPRWWESKDASERHDYSYTESELTHQANLAVNLVGKTDVLWVVFNNTTKGHAIRNSSRFKELLSDRGLEVQWPPGLGLWDV